MAAKKKPRYHISKKLGLAFDRINPTVHELDQAAYAYTEKRKKDKRTQHALTKG